MQQDVLNIAQIDVSTRVVFRAQVLHITMSGLFECRERDSGRMPEPWFCADAKITPQ
jgi:hypothetical protein